MTLGERIMVNVASIRHSPEKVQTWLIRILGHEGGYSEDDKVGGPTKWGISQKAYPYLDIASLTVEYAEGIYRRDYLDLLHADLFEDGVAYQLLDFAVNSGPVTAIKQLQEAVGCKPDGNVGPVTLAALAALSESDLVMLLIAERLDFMASLKNWPENSKGWTRRMAQNLRYAALDTE